MCFLRPLAIVLAAAALAVAPLDAAQSQAQPSAAHALLDVPYVSQTPELCGGAAVAMVLRYWGERDVFAQDFASLVSPDAGGIVTGALASAVRERGWQAFEFSPQATPGVAWLRSELDLGRPLIALIEVAPHTFHFVVILGSTERDIVVHDPARAPYRVLSWTEFERAWSAAGRWTLMVLPQIGHAPTRGAMGGRPEPTPAIVTGGESHCDGMVAQSVELALAGDAERAERGLRAAADLCPLEPGPWRELAGLRFTQARWPEARDAALTAARLAPADQYAWQLVATSRYLLGDAQGSLEAWNHVGEPRIDLLDVRGLSRTSQPVIARATGLQPRQLLTPAAYTRALRRVNEVPAVASAQLRYEVSDDGLATVHVVVEERPLLPRNWTALSSLGARAVLQDEASLDLPGGLGAGERERVLLRWARGRPHVGVEVALPFSARLPGVVSLEGVWDQQSYSTELPTGPAATREVRQRLALSVADWSAGWLHWKAGATFDRWRTSSDGNASLPLARADLGLEAAADARFAADHLALRVSAGWWTPGHGAGDYGEAGLRAAWRSTIDMSRPWWSADVALDSASARAPRGLWQGAGTGQARSGLLRAHPLIDSGVLDGPAFGRELMRGSVEYARPVARVVAGRISVAAFADAARAWNRLGALSASPLYVDAGVGLRLRVPASNSVIRIDLAHGVRGGGATLSAGWDAAWPR